MPISIRQLAYGTLSLHIIFCASYHLLVAYSFTHDSARRQNIEHWLPLYNFIIVCFWF